VGRLDLADVPRDEDSRTLWSADASRAIAKGDYSGAIAVMLELGYEPAKCEAIVALQLAVNTPVPIRDRRLLFLVETARRAMSFNGWSFDDAAAAIELAQSTRDVLVSKGARCLACIERDKLARSGS
jgi:hypothetical protein